MEDYKDQDEIFSNKVRAGKRTYFFDVRATRANDYYLTITESKKIFNRVFLLSSPSFLFPTKGTNTRSIN